MPAPSSPPPAALASKAAPAALEQLTPLAGTPVSLCAITPPVEFRDAPAAPPADNGDLPYLAPEVPDDGGLPSPGHVRRSIAAFNAGVSAVEGLLRPKKAPVVVLVDDMSPLTPGARQTWPVDDRGFDVDDFGYLRFDLRRAVPPGAHSSLSPSPSSPLHVPPGVSRPLRPVPVVSITPSEDVDLSGSLDAGPPTPPDRPVSRMSYLAPCSDDISYVLPSPRRRRRPSSAPPDAPRTPVEDVAVDEVDMARTVRLAMRRPSDLGIIPISPPGTVGSSPGDGDVDDDGDLAGDEDEVDRRFNQLRNELFEVMQRSIDSVKTPHGSLGTPTPQPTPQGEPPAAVVEQPVVRQTLAVPAATPGGVSDWTPSPLTPQVPAKGFGLKSLLLQCACTGPLAVRRKSAAQKPAATWYVKVRTDSATFSAATRTTCMRSPPDHCETRTLLPLLCIRSTQSLSIVAVYRAFRSGGNLKWVSRAACNRGSAGTPHGDCGARNALTVPSTPCT
ncbi:SH3 and multiple ankyrin repeat domains protein 1-like isoform X2 [Frankliniella occidentalis]|uniref:SH3 and multiple ankyrin repeat domains protein 1-like isoform X2 n=1 Tax=Frankliniella occidentalis TaxID=133901 RepID=A0A9C6XW49_FRAOC|nr:SH3 and multiple ankyrin repeat domains protein 1-like isoform X2 [Frankliniella occidentalis]